MAMAVNPNSKQLGRHAVPVIMVVAVMLAASAATFGAKKNATSSRNPLFSGVVHVKPNPSGLSKVSIGDNEQAVAAPTNDFDQLGRSAQFSVKLESSEN